MQPPKAYPSMLVTDSGIVTLVNPVQFLKASYPILVTELGIVMFVKPVHRENIQFGMFFTFFPIMIDDKVLQPLNTGE